MAAHNALALVVSPTKIRRGESPGKEGKRMGLRLVSVAA
jgi:hypothetical protein